MTHFPLRLTLFFFLTFVFLFPAKSDQQTGSAAWRSLSNVQTALGSTNCVWDGDSLCFSNDQHVVRFYQGRRKFDVDGTTLWLNAPPDGSVTGGDWRIAATDLDLLQLAVLPKDEGAAKPLCVMLDPGHGGDDDGASSRDPVVREKDLTLSIARLIGASLTNAGLQVVYTRTNDATLTLDQRSLMARRAKADLFVSVHINRASNAEAAGIETYVLTPCGYSGTAEGSRVRGWQIGNRNDFHNTMLGYSIHRRLIAQAQSCDRGLKRQSFSVLRETSCPAVLIEFGFLSNHAETVRMLDGAWQAKCAAAVTEGVLAYAKKADALDKAVAEKRARDAEANERWRQHLASQTAKAFPAVSTNKAPAIAIARAVPAPLPQTPAACAPTAERAVLAASTSSTTNVAPIVLGSLFDFYATGQTE